MTIRGKKNFSTSFLRHPLPPRTTHPQNKPQTTQTPYLNMTPGRRLQQSIPSQIPRPTPQAYQTYNPFFNLHPKNFQRGIWLDKTRDHFHQLILWAERQPSNGSVRGVDRPDGETRFTVAYGDGPDGDLQDLLVCLLLLNFSHRIEKNSLTDHASQESIHAKHGEVSLRHDGRDSTGKHWIKCFEVIFHIFYRLLLIY